MPQQNSILADGVGIGLSGGLARRSRQFKRASSMPEHAVLDPPAKIVLGVCAMDKKARSKPMREILNRMTSFNEFEVVTFGDQVILELPVEEWPKCDCLLSWHSDGFPLHKAQAYVALRRPFCVNDLVQQETLLDRRSVYRTLMENSIPVPHHIIVSRTQPGETPPGFIEDPDWVEMGGVRIPKPFVEKPISGEDHNIHIYYPHHMGGGVKRLFRKVDNKSADYDPDHPGTVRRDGSYIYEEFLTTGGTDVKVYTVGPRYAHAEARKSPVVDGKVQRAPDGKELRYPVLLSPQEKEISRMVCLAFGQKVCGFDLLRSEKGRSFVCDVNGWSFVKNSKKYYDDAAGILRSIILNALAPHRLSTMPMLVPAPIPALLEDDEAAHEEQLMKDMEAMELDEGVEGNPDEELRCVLAVIRHGDRTPKQKLKLTVTQPSLLALFDKHRDVKGKQAKLKTPQQLSELLEVVRALQPALDRASLALGPRPAPAPGPAPAAPPAPPCPPGGPAGGSGGGSGVEGEGQGLDPLLGAAKDKDAVDELREKLRIVRQVLEQGGGQFSGVNRKVQLKPLSWARPLTATISLPTLPAHPGPPPPPSPSPAPSLGGLGAGVGGGAGVGEGGGSGQGGAACGAQPTSGSATPLRSNLSRGGAPAGPALLESALLVVKWGGILTHAGRKQAEDLGMAFRACMYPRHGPAGGGLLRLHSTYRHDLKIYSSDEGRVQVSAAAFTKGLLDLEGNSLTPILVSLVNKDASMLEAYGKGASDEMQLCKAVITSQLTGCPPSRTTSSSSIPGAPCPLPPALTKAAGTGLPPPSLPPHPSSTSSGAPRSSSASPSLTAPSSSTHTSPIAYGAPTAHGTPPPLPSPSPPCPPPQHDLGQPTNTSPPETLHAVAATNATTSPCPSPLPSPTPAASQPPAAAPPPDPGAPPAAGAPAVTAAPANGDASSEGGAGGRAVVEGGHGFSCSTAAGVEQARVGLPGLPRLATGGGLLGPGSATSVGTPTRSGTPVHLTHLPASWPALSATASSVAYATGGGAGHAGDSQGAPSRSASPALPYIPPAAGSAETPRLRHLPEAPVALLHQLAALTRDVVSQLHTLTRNEKFNGSKSRGYNSQNHAPEEWEELAGKPCSGESLLMLYERWRKLSRALYSEKKGAFDISKIPDIYDSTKHDAIHNSHLGIDFSELYQVAKALADVVIPHEYGLEPRSKLSIGSKIAKELVGKLLCDMASMREESVVTAGSWSQADEEGQVVGSGDEMYCGADSMATEFGRVCLEDEMLRTRAGQLSTSASPAPGKGRCPEGEEGGEGGEEEAGAVEAETLHRLCPTYASDINSPLRHVRTRIYFTSESHIHSLVNVFRFASLREGYEGPPLVAGSGQELLDSTPEFDYLTHIVLRMYENKAVPVDSSQRFRVEVLLSPGAAYDPTLVHPPRHALPTVPRVHLNAGTAETLAELEELLAPFSTARKVSPSIYALQVALKAPSAFVSRNGSAAALGSHASNTLHAAPGTTPGGASPLASNISTSMGRVSFHSHHHSAGTGADLREAAGPTVGSVTREGGSAEGLLTAAGASLLAQQEQGMLLGRGGHSGRSSLGSSGRHGPNALEVDATGQHSAAEVGAVGVGGVMMCGVARAVSTPAPLVSAANPIRVVGALGMAAVGEADEECT